MNYNPNHHGPGGVTVLLRAAAGGDRHVLDTLFEAVYHELQGLAHRVRGGRGGETLNTTALVHEAYIKLVPSSDISWQDRAHFFGVAARAMRQILVDAARRMMTEKRGGADQFAVTLDEQLSPAPVKPAELIALDDALNRLSQLDERQAQIVEQRFFAGLTAVETAEVLQVSEATVNRDWRVARAWLKRELQEAS